MICHTVVEGYLTTNAKIVTQIKQVFLHSCVLAVSLFKDNAFKGTILLQNSVSFGRRC